MSFKFKLSQREPTLLNEGKNTLPFVVSEGNLTEVYGNVLERVPFLYGNLNLQLGKENEE